MASILGGKILSAIDIGTTKICVLVAQISKNGSMEIIGFGQHPSYGLKKGVVSNISSAVNSIKKALAKAEKSAGFAIKTAVVGISGSHIQSINSSGVVPIKYREVSQNDIDRVIEAARAVPIPEDREILHVIPQYFRVDGEDRIEDSLGMHGVRLESQVHIVTGSVSSAQNIIKACELAGVSPTDIVLEQIASAEAVLSSSERELGVGILDIGGGTSDFAIYKSGKIMHSKVFPIAGNHFTNDLAIGLSIPVAHAEDAKKKFGFVVEEKYLEYGKSEMKFKDEDGNNKKIDIYKMYEILNPRATEVYEFVIDDILACYLMPMLQAGLVLTGGGSLLNGMKELAIQELGLSTRVGIPRSIQDDNQSSIIPDMLKSPIYSTAYGTLLYAARGGDKAFEGDRDKTRFSRIFKKMKSWLYDFL
ncbi:cell division protein FtsA [bacterium]|nr:cell division protein FtsA [bacterium]